MSKTIVKDNQRNIVIALGDSYFEQNKTAKFKDKTSGEWVAKYSEPSAEELENYWKLNGDTQTKLEAQIRLKELELKELPAKVKNIEAATKDWKTIVKDKNSTKEEVEMAKSKVADIEKQAQELKDKEEPLEKEIISLKGELKKLLGEKEEEKKK